MEEDKWIVLLLRDRFNTRNEKERVCNELIEKHELSENDIFTVKKEHNPSLSFYVFVKESEKTKDINFSYKYNNYFDGGGTAIITNSELLDMTRDVNTARGYVKFGDVVLIKTGIYKHLYGIVVRQTKKNIFAVGIKLCSNTFCIDYRDIDIEVVNNIFNYIKINS